MSKKQRILICVIILIVDLAVFFLTLTAIFFVYINYKNTPRFRELLQQKKPADRSY